MVLFLLLSLLILRCYKSFFLLDLSLLLCFAVGGEERSQLVAGDVTAVDLDQLDPGVQYEVQVMALVQNREGAPVSVSVTTRESCLLDIIAGNVF